MFNQETAVKPLLSSLHPRENLTQFEIAVRGVTSPLLHSRGLFELFDHAQLTTPVAPLACTALLLL